MGGTGPRRRRALAALGLALALAACGKKGPLRLPEDRTAEDAPSPRARVSETNVVLDFRVPSPRIFPERQERWVMARILRQTVGSAEVVEAGAIFESGGFAYGAALTWTDRGLPPKSSLVYQIEFRDAERRRRALSKPLPVAWNVVPGAPSALSASGGGRAVSLTWTAPESGGAGLRYRVYRRAAPQGDLTPLTPEPVGESRFLDSRTEPGREYCYAVRGVLVTADLEVEGPSGTQVCVLAAAEDKPPQEPPGSGP